MLIMGVYGTGTTGAQAPAENQQRVPVTCPKMAQVWLFYQKYKCVGWFGIDVVKNY